MNPTQHARTGQQQTATRADAAPLSNTTIIRLAFDTNDPYFRMPRASAQDGRLSFTARGMLTYLLSKPPDWQVMMSNLEREGGQGRDATRRIFRELETHGYVTRERQHRASGRFGWVCTVHPLAQDSAALAPSDSPLTENPSPVKPSPVKASIYREQRKQETEETKNRTHTPPQPLTAEPAQASVCVSEVEVKRGKSASRFNLSDCRRYAEHLKATGQGIINPGGYATKIHNTGEADELIETFLSGKSVEQTAAPGAREATKKKLESIAKGMAESGKDESTIRASLVNLGKMLRPDEVNSIAHQAFLAVEFRAGLRSKNRRTQQVSDATPAV